MKIRAYGPKRNGVIEFGLGIRYCGAVHHWIVIELLVFTVDIWWMRKDAKCVEK